MRKIVNKAHLLLLVLTIILTSCVNNNSHILVSKSTKGRYYLVQSKDSLYLFDDISTCIRSPLSEKYLTRDLMYKSMHDIDSIYTKQIEKNKDFIVLQYSSAKSKCIMLDTFGVLPYISNEYDYIDIYNYNTGKIFSIDDLNSNSITFIQMDILLSILRARKDKTDQHKDLIIRMYKDNKLVDTINTYQFPKIFREINQLVAKSDSN